LAIAIGSSSLLLSVGMGVAGASTAPKYPHADLSGEANASAHPGVTSDEIKLGLVTSLSGSASAFFGPQVVTGAKAAIDQVNAEGGIDGRKLVLAHVADDASSPTQALTAVQSLVSDGVFGIISASPLFFEAAPYTTKEGIPTATGCYDGPECGVPTNYNLFGYFGSYASGYPTFTTIGQILKAEGVTKLAVVGNANSPSSEGGSNEIAASAKLAGIDVVDTDFTQQVGGTDYTATAITLKNDGANGVATEMIAASNAALLTDLQQSGVKLKGTFIANGYNQGLLQDSTYKAASQGLDFASPYEPEDISTPATKAYTAALKKYAGWDYPNPSAGLNFGWFTTQTMIEGLKVAGKNPTWGSFIKNLHNVTDYTAGGLTSPINYSLIGNVEGNSAGGCIYMSKVEGNKFVPLRTKPFCGTEIAGTNNSATS
jgi:ABC-type branched-subunit amino acid transport system substrate-binding protein